MLIGNLTRDPELRYTPSGSAVCTIGLATNRYWTTEAGEKKEEVEFHRVVAWNKLAEVCSQLLTKGRKIYVEGRLRTAAWQAQDGSQRTTTEVIMEDMILLDSRLPAAAAAQSAVNDTATDDGGTGAPAASARSVASDTKKSVAQPSVVPDRQEGAEAGDNAKKEDVNPDDIPF